MATRKEIQAKLSSVGVTNKFTLRTVGFSDLARDSAQVCEIQDWTPSENGKLVRDILKPLGVIVMFNGKGIIQS